MTRILVVDDEVQILRALRINLKARGYDVATASTGAEALAVAARHQPELVVLDLGLPDLDGVEVIQGLRGWSQARILVLSGRTDSADKVAAGADDYVVKPVGMDELLARLRALSRRQPEGEAAPVLTLGDVVVDLAATRVVRRGPDGEEELRLTPTEWHLLEVLARHPGKLMSHAQLLREVWGPGYENAHGNLRLYIGQLRRKIEDDPARPRHLLTDPGMGYRLSP